MIVAIEHDLSRDESPGIQRCVRTRNRQKAGPLLIDRVGQHVRQILEGPRLEHEPVRGNHFGAGRVGHDGASMASRVRARHFV